MAALEGQELAESRPLLENYPVFGYGVVSQEVPMGMSVREDLIMPEFR